MRIGVLSDSHVHALEELPRKAVDELRGMDLIVHAGDYTHKRVLDELGRLGTFKGVYGNLDPPEVRAELPQRQVLELGGFTIGVTHPSEGGPPFGLEKRVRTKFDQVDVIVYGHSHWTYNETTHGILYFNPGSIVGKFPARQRTFGVLTLGKTVTGEIVKL